MASGSAGAVRALPDATAQAAVFDEHRAVRPVLAGTRHCRLSYMSVAGQVSAEMAGQVSAEKSAR